MSEQADKDAVTLNTIRRWVERTIETTVEAPPQSRSAGFRHAARSVEAIMDASDLPPGAPVVFPAADR